MRLKLRPFGIKDRSKTELPTLIALSAIGQPWFSEFHLADMQIVGMVCEAMEPKDSDVSATAHSLLLALSSEVLDADEVGPSLMELSNWMQRQSNGRIQQALDRLAHQSQRLAA